MIIVEHYRMLRDLLRNPHQYAAAILAKICVNLATMIWSVIVLSDRDALSRWPGYSIIHAFDFYGNVGGERVLAIALLIMSIFGLLHLIRRSVPIPIGSLLYAAMLLVWLYVWFSIIFYSHEVYSGPSQFASVTIVTALAVFAFISNPKANINGAMGV